MKESTYLYGASSPVTELTKWLTTDCDSCVNRFVQGAKVTLCVGVSDCTGRRDGEKTHRVWRCRIGLGRGGVGDEAIRTDVELRPEDVDSFFFCS